MAILSPLHKKPPAAHAAVQVGDWMRISLALGAVLALLAAPVPVALAQDAGQRAPGGAPGAAPGGSAGTPHAG
ncbi:hypothetical protein HMPREF9946_03891, partial [Acetobacteraceae bacterium AT-5844]